MFYIGKKNFPPRKKITDYSAKTVTSKPNEKSAYVLEVSKGRYLDENDASNYVGGYINSNKHTGKKPNVRFTRGARIQKER